MTSSPPIYTSLAGPETLKVTVQELDGNSIAADVITVQLTKPGVKPTSWLGTTNVSTSTDGTTRVVKFQVTAAVCPTAGTYDLWVRINDGTDVPIRKEPAQVVVG